eukprot:Gb_11510 [translate_table: standard]
MGHGYSPPEPTDNLNKNSSSSSPIDMIVSQSGRGKANRKKSRVTRSQINDFHANINSDDIDMLGMSSGRKNRYHICKHCNRAFSSGRALGGHIRIHGASFNGARTAIPTDSSNNSSSKSLFRTAELDRSDEEESSSSSFQQNIADEEEEEEEEQEEELSNGFSQKMVSLYTLRNNPKRSSLIMDPEFSLELLGGKRSWQESSSGSGSEQKTAAAQFVNWSVTRNRSSRRLRRQDPDAPTPKEVAADERDTANLLVMLAGSANGGVEEVTEESVYDSKLGPVLNLESQGSIEDSGSGEDLGSKSRNIKDKDKKRRRRKPKVSEDGEAGSFFKDTELDAGKSVHQCNTCKKLFNSHQALGGHRASHRKVKGCFAAEEQGTPMTESEAVNVDVNVNVNIMKFSPPGEEEGAVTLSHLTQEESPEQESFSKKVPKAHRCSICHRVFPSGQALGGHKRCHWIGDRVTETATSVISTDKEQQQSGAPNRSPKDELLDLNQPPPMDEDDLEAAYGMVDVVPVCAESVNKRVKMLEAVTNTTVDSFNAAS